MDLHKIIEENVSSLRQERNDLLLQIQTSQEQWDEVEQLWKEIRDLATMLTLNLSEALCINPKP